MKLCNDAVTNCAEGVPNAVSREARSARKKCVFLIIFVSHSVIHCHVVSVDLSQNGPTIRGSTTNGLVWSGPIWPGKIMVWSGLDHQADHYAFSELVQHLMVWSDLIS